VTIDVNPNALQHGQPDVVQRRAFFKQNLWNEDQAGIDLKQVWFAGCHSDIGGANPLAKLALEWMLLEASEHGLLVDPDAALAVLNEPRLPDHRAPIVESLVGAWKVCEYFPKLTWDPRTRRQRPRLNRGRSRWIADDALVHGSALKRHAEGDYRPDNFPDHPREEKWQRFEEHFGRSLSGQA